MNETKALVAQAGKTLAEAGWIAASRYADKREQLRLRVLRASEFYRYISLDRLAEFNHNLRRHTENLGMKLFGPSRVYLKLSNTSVSTFPGIPPARVVEKFKEAQERECFDEFSVLHIIEHREEKPVRLDPILVGQIEGLRALFVIDQWGDDVEVADILTALEG